MTMNIDSDIDRIHYYLQATTATVVSECSVHVSVISLADTPCSCCI